MYRLHLFKLQLSQLLPQQKLQLQSQPLLLQSSKSKSPQQLNQLLLLSQQLNQQLLQSKPQQRQLNQHQLSPLLS
jgi:hypothetical protein